MKQEGICVRQRGWRMINWESRELRQKLRLGPTKIGEDGDERSSSLCDRRGIDPSARQHPSPLRLLENQPYGFKLGVGDECYPLHSKVTQISLRMCSCCSAQLLRLRSVDPTPAYWRKAQEEALTRDVTKFTRGCDTTRCLMSKEPPPGKTQ